MDAALRQFLDAHPAHCEVRDDWPLAPAVPLLARLCLGSSLPPPAFVASVVAIVTRPDGTVLFAEPARPSGTIAHLLVGGRPLPGEPPEETVRREVAEETGWNALPGPIVGFRHFRQLGPPHPGMAGRPYPDFVEPVYAASARSFDESSRLPGERTAELVEAGWALGVTDPAHRPLLEAALTAVGLLSAERSTGTEPS